MKKKLIIANWKSNPDSPGRAVVLAKKIDLIAKKFKTTEVVIAPPAPFLMPVGSAIKFAKLGAQDVFWEDVGAYTGETSWHQFKHLKVNHVIIGHSERRRLLKETDEMINKKVLACLKHDLGVVLCVGEPKSIRARGILEVKKFIAGQLGKDLKNLSHIAGRMSLVIAYEPIWAIGGGRPDEPQEAAEIISFIKNLLLITYYLPSPRVLYGGSVNQENASSFLSRKEIDGALVGGASLKPQEFLKIIESAK